MGLASLTAEGLVSEYGDRLYAAALVICKNHADAEDLAYRTLERAIERIGDYRGESSLFSWLYSILFNFRRMDARRKGANALVPVEAVPEQTDEGPTPAEAMAAASDAAAIRAAVEALPEHLRDVVVMRYFADMSLAEIAKARGIPLGTVKYHVHEAKAALAQRLAPTFAPKNAS